MPQERYRVRNSDSPRTGAPSRPPRKASSVPSASSASSRQRKSAREVSDPEARARAAQKKRAQEEARRRRIEEEKRLARLRRKRRSQLFRISGALALIFVVLYWSFVAIRIATRPGVSSDALPLQVYRESEKEADFSYEAKEVVFGGTTYLPVTFLEEYFPISVFGDEKSLSFMITATGEYASFAIGTCNVLINGQSAANSDSALLRDGILYIPIDFFTEKMNCFSFSYSAAKESNVLTYSPAVSPAFLFHAPVSSVGVKADTIPTPAVPEEAPTA